MYKIHVITYQVIYTTADTLERPKKNLNDHKNVKIKV